MKKSFYIALLVVTAPNAYSLDPYPYLYRSSYYLGRGDTGIASADNEHAVFYNPAGIGFGKGIYKRIVLASPTLEFSRDTTNVAQEISVQEADVTETLRKRLGRPQTLALRSYTGIILRRAALSLFGATELTTLLSKDPKQGAFEKAEGKLRVDTGGIFTLAHKLFTEKLYMGLNMKFISRVQAAFSANATEASQLKNIESDQYAMTGRGFGFDIGLMYRTEGRTPFKAGITLMDAGGTSFTPLKKTSLAKSLWALKDIKQTVNLGIALEPGTRVSKFKLMLDIRDLTDQYTTSYFKKLHIGTELTVADIVGFTGGLNQGYGSIGLYIDTYFFRLDIGYYAEELGDYAGHRPDERFYLTLYFGI